MSSPDRSETEGNTEEDSLHAVQQDNPTVEVSMETYSDPKEPTTTTTTTHVTRGQDSDKPASLSQHRGHQRSVSHGGGHLQLQDQERQQQQEPLLLVKSDIKVASAVPRSIIKGHRRVFSHGQIVDQTSEAMDLNLPQSASYKKGHKRSVSKTEFILPPGHEERERKRTAASAVSRTGSHRVGSSSERFHRRQPSRTDSLAFSFRGHSRQASRTDSVYTLRPDATNYRNKIFCFGRRRHSEAETTKHRLVVPNHIVPPDSSPNQHPNRAYLDNYVRTTKYTVLSFLPKNLFEQFHRFANLYFLFIVLLNWIPAINAFGKEVSMIPVIFVLGVTAIKDIFEDRRRYVSDKRVNNSSCRVYKASAGRYVKSLWKDIKVGDLVHLSNNEMIPADILLLRSSDEQGLCYIDTQNLDGEANLKQREVPRGFVEKQKCFSPQEFRSSLECDMPTTKIYRFHGSIVHPTSSERIPVGKDNLLLRECVIKNTDYVEGLVVYAGHESKAMLNNGGPRYKRSKLERQMNLEVIWCVFILILLCFMGAIGSGTWWSSYMGFVPFITGGEEPNSPSWEGFLTFWTFVIILQVIIPLSLYVTIEMTKLAQVYLIHNDIDMFDPECQKKVECRALNIPEELGQIQYMFCDKTGTLTENNMVFKRCTISGVDFNHNSLVQKSQSGIRKTIIPVNPSLNEKLTTFDMNRLLDNNGSKSHLNEPTQNQMVQDFFLLLAVCNTVIVAKHPHKDEMNASGIVCNSAATSMSKLTSSKSEISNLGAKGANAKNGDYIPNSLEEEGHRLEQVPEESSLGVNSSSPPSSYISTTSSTAPLRPDPSLTPRRPNRLLDLLPSKPLSPIASSPLAGSPATTPTTIAETTKGNAKHLQLPNILNPISKLVSYNSSSSLVNFAGKQQMSRASTPNSLVEFSKPIFEAESPDELALVDAAYAYNCKLLRRTPYQIMVSIPGEGMVDFEVLHILPFDSNRKRMSVILMHPQKREKILFCKGADSTMFPRLEPPSDQREQEILEKTQQHLNSYAKLGLRVLVMAKRVLNDTEYKEWAEVHGEAENSLTNREKLLAESYSKIENRMKLVGTTGIEDKLQDGVPETISNLRSAGIVVWVLTGDKQETAINIAYSCKLFSEDMKIIVLNARTRNAAESTIKYHLNAIKAAEKEEEARKDLSKSFLKSKVSKKDQRAVVVDGKTLIYILDKRANLQDSFLNLTSQCSSVLCCRATPLQKAYIVKIVKEELKMHTLAVGDGANDVSMIQTADVGVGISGQEGRQAVMASDFAISRFKFIERLLLVHGHWNYDRLARMVLYFFYKNAAFVFVCFWYQLYCGFSGAVMIDQMYLMLYNMIFTSLPPMAIGVFDQDLPDVTLLSNPRLYDQGRLGEVYKRYSFWINMADALFQSLVIFFTSLGAYWDSDVGIWEFGTVMCTQCLFTMLLHLGIETKSWTIVHWTSSLLSILSYFAFALFYNGICVNNCFGTGNSPYWVIQNAMGTLHFWIVCLLSSVLALLPRIVVRTAQNSLYPTEVSKVIIANNKLKQNSVANLEVDLESWRNESSSTYNKRNSFTKLSGMARNGCLSKRSSEMEMIPS